MDCSLRGDEDAGQLSWFKDALKGAKEKDYFVLVAYHYGPDSPSASPEQIKCNFTEVDHKGIYEGYQDDTTPYYQAVEDFKAEGGKFVMWLCGHTHWEQFCYSKDFPTQLNYCIDATNRYQSMMYGNMTRKDGTRSQDLANAMVVDTTPNTIKIIRIGANETNLLIQRKGICINYKTYEVISQF